MIKEILFPTCVYSSKEAISKKDKGIIKKDIFKKWKKTSCPNWQSESILQLEKHYKRKFSCSYTCKQLFKWSLLCSNQKYTNTLYRP